MIYGSIAPPDPSSPSTLKAWHDTVGGNLVTLHQIRANQRTLSLAVAGVDCERESHWRPNVALFLQDHPASEQCASIVRSYLAVRATNIWTPPIYGSSKIHDEGLNRP